MKENSIFTTGLFVVALLLLFLSVGRLLGENDPERFKISVVVDHSNSDVWSGFKMGLTAAGRAYNMEYNFVSTDRLVSIQQENISMQREIQSGADGIIAELRATEGTGSLLNALGKNAEIMLVDSEKETTEPGLNISSVNVEEEALGKALAEQVLSTMAKALKKPLTVKFRIGFTDDAINVVEFAKMAEASGVASVTIHGRTREQYYRGKANWQYIKEAKEAVKIPVFGNGDIFQEEDALAMLLSTGVDGIALARGIQGNPFLIRACVSLLSEGKKLPPVSISERKEMMLRHLKLMVEIKGEHLALLEMRKHLSWYMEGLENAARWRQRVNTENDLEKVFQMVREL